MSEPSHLVARIPIAIDDAVRYLHRKLERPSTFDDWRQLLAGHRYHGVDDRWFDQVDDLVSRELTAAQWFVTWLGRSRGVYLTYDDENRVLSYIVAFVGAGLDIFVRELAIVRQIAALKQHGGPGHVVIYSPWGDSDPSDPGHTDAVLRVDAGVSAILPVDAPEATLATRAAYAMVEQYERRGDALASGGEVDIRFAPALATAMQQLEQARAAYEAGWESVVFEAVGELRRAVSRRRTLARLEKLNAPENILAGQLRMAESAEQAGRSKFAQLAERGAPRSSRTACEGYIAWLDGDKGRARELHRQALSEDPEDAAARQLGKDIG